MADKLKAKKGGEDNSFAGKVEGIKSHIKKVNALKDEAKEANGEAGSATKTAVDTLHVNKWAFTALAQASKKEPTEQIDRALTFFGGALGLGLLNQTDAFDDRLAFIHAELGKLLDGTPRAAAAGASNVTKLTSASQH